MRGLYLVTDRVLCGRRSLEEVVVAAVRGGVSAVQLREKKLSARNFVEAAIALRKLLAPFGVPLIVNDRVDVAFAAKADGAHIGQNDIPLSAAREILGPNAIIGVTVETLDELKQADKWDVDYLGVGPIFPTPTKSDAGEPWGLAGLREARSVSRHLLVAIGGINLSNASAVFAAGADSIAVVSAICAADDPEQAARELCVQLD